MTQSADPFSDSQPAEPKDISGLFKSGAACCRFQNIGDVHTGVILDSNEAQQRDITTGEPALWPDGKPKQMIVLTLQTKERDPEIDDDDGERRLYVNIPSGMFAAIATAIKISKAKLAIGGTLAVKFTGLGQKKNPAFNAPKEYKAIYTPPGGAPATTPAAPATPATDTAHEAMIAAKRTFAAKMPGKTKEQLGAIWTDAVQTFFGAVSVDQLTTAQWRRFIAQDFVPTTNPFSCEPETDADVF